MIRRDPAEPAINWPAKRDLFGVAVSSVTCEQACVAIMEAARSNAAAVVSAFSVHALIEAATRPKLAMHANRFAIITPDGQPVRWALNWLHGAGLQRNVRGSELMWRLCERAAAEGVSIYLYGSSPATLAALRANLSTAFPTLRVAGAESPPFRPLTAEEDAAMVARVNDSGAGLMFLGLGCPKQDYFAAEHADRIRAVQLCVGAAFDFHAGMKAVAPRVDAAPRFGMAFPALSRTPTFVEALSGDQFDFARKLSVQILRRGLLRVRLSSKASHKI